MKVINFLRILKQMPLSKRRRHKPSTTKQVPQCTVRYPVGFSPLEQLPVEILTQIFLESQNVDFTRTSKAIYNVLGHNPSEWLIFEFFRYPITGSSLVATTKVKKMLR
jgi:hypothetical protein